MDKAQKDLEKEKKKSRMWMGIGITAMVIGVILLFVVIYLALRGPEIKYVKDPGSIGNHDIKDVKIAEGVIKAYNIKLREFGKVGKPCPPPKICPPPCPLGKNITGQQPVSTLEQRRLLRTGQIRQE